MNPVYMSIYQVLVVLLVIHPVLLFLFSEIRNVANREDREIAVKNFFDELELRPMRRAARSLS